MTNSSRDYRRAEQDRLADELVNLIALWRNPKNWWWQRAAIGHAIVCKVSYRLDTIVEALRGGEGK